MNDVISLLSDDETTDTVVEPPKKKLKMKIKSISRKSSINGCATTSKPVTIIDSIALSDDEENFEINVPSLNNKPSVPENPSDVITKDEPSEIDNSQSSADDIVWVIEEKSKEDNASTVVNDEVTDEVTNETKLENNEEEEEEKASTSRSKGSSSDDGFDAFNNKCAELLERSKFNDLYIKKRNKVEKLYRALLKRDKLNDFKEFLQPEMENLKDTESAFICFTRVFVYLRDSYKNCEVVNTDLLQKIKRLEKVSRVLYKRIKKLEETPVDFDDDDDSAYIQLSAYKSKYVKVDAKLCQLYDIDSSAERIIHKPLNFCDSNYPLINKAIKVKYNKATESPDFCEFNKYIRKYLKHKNFLISESELTGELTVCFRNLCKLMEQRRKRDLYDVHKDYIEAKEADIEFSNQELCQKLESNRREGESRMAEVLRKFTLLQEEGKKVAVSSDSDDSNIEESDLEDQENGNQS